MVAVPHAVEAQRGKPPVIGVLSPWGPSLRPAGQREPFERGLRELGWTPGSTVVIEQRYADGHPDPGGGASPDAGERYRGQRHLRHPGRP
jgi:hypothetical protein